MLIDVIFEPYLYAFVFKTGEVNELKRLTREWSDTEYLFNFFLKHEADLPIGVSIEEAIEKVKIQSIQLDALLKKLSKEGKEGLDTLFRNLDDTQTGFKTLQKQKAKVEKAWGLRLYAIRIDNNCYVITGGAIKLTNKMQDRPHTQRELDKLEQCRSYLFSEGISDIDSFKEIII